MYSHTCKHIYLQIYLRICSIAFKFVHKQTFHPTICFSPGWKLEKISFLVKFVYLIFKVMQANGLDERTNLLVEEYSTSGRLDNITQVMSIHTQYLESFLRSQFYMLRMDGPLPLPYRHYIAIMVCTSRLYIFSCDLGLCIWKRRKKEDFIK